MRSSNLAAALVACTVALGLATAANALEKADPVDPSKQGGGGGTWGIGPGPSDPSLGGMTMPPGGDERKQKEAERKDREAERKRKETERKKAEADKPAAKSIGKVNLPRHTSTQVSDTARWRVSTKPMVSDSTTASRGASAAGSGATGKPAATTVKAAPLPSLGREGAAPLARSAPPSSFTR